MKNNKKIKKILKILLVIISIIFISIFTCNYIGKSNADAGYHSSYSSGSSSSHSSSSSSHSSHSSHSSSSSSSSSSSRSSSSHSSSSGSSSDSDIPGIIVVIMIIFIVVVVELATKKSKVSNNNYTSTNKNNIVVANNNEAINEIKKYIPNFDTSQFLSNGYNIFVRIEEAWMNFDLEKVRDCITDEMFNMYESQLASMEMKGEQNIMKGFNKINYCITDALKENNILEIKAKYYVSFYDYIINRKTKKVIRGNSNTKIKMVYEFTFIKDIENDKIDKCPNCGAPININSAGICEYCNSKLVDDSKNWVMSKKVSLIQL